MPFYEYECSSCKHHVEALQKISDAPLRKCPDCGKAALKRLISAPVFRLKGGGWYETDFKSDQEKKRNLAGADEAGQSKDDSKGDSKSESTGAKADPASDKAKPVEAKTEKADKKPEVASKSASKNRPAAKAARAKPAAKKKAARR